MHWLAAVGGEQVIYIIISLKYLILKPIKFSEREVTLKKLENLLRMLQSSMKITSESPCGDQSGSGASSGPGREEKMKNSESPSAEGGTEEFSRVNQMKEPKKREHFRT